jgi:hypothetical protein
MAEKPYNTRANRYKAIQINERQMTLDWNDIPTEILMTRVKFRRVFTSVFWRLWQNVTAKNMPKCLQEGLGGVAEGKRPAGRRGA